MLLQITHDTRYSYLPMVDIAQHVGHLTPRELGTQRVLRSSLLVSPEPDWQEQMLDVFGNARSFFSIQSRHESLQIRASSLVETMASTIASGWIETARPISNGCSTWLSSCITATIKPRVISA